jgi:hypothetical protein
MKLTVGVTGHRDLVEEELPALRDGVRAFFAGLRADFPGLELQLISPLAEGADQLVAEVALELGIHLIVPLPMEQSEYEKDFSSDAERKNFRALLDRAEIVALPLALGVARGDILEQGPEREGQYAQMGVFVSNHCQILLALWNGKPDTQVGGTYGVVQYHLTAVMPGYSVVEESPNLLADNENDLTYHIVVSRRSEEGAPATGLRPLEGRWMSAHFEQWPGQEMPFEYHRALQRLQEFNADLEKYRDRIEREARGLLEEAPPLQEPWGLGLVHGLFRKVDWLAIHFQARINQGMIVTHTLAVVMGLVFIVYAEYEGAWTRVMLYLFLALFAIGVVFHIVGNRRGWHRKYLDYRALAEGLRVQFYWTLAGVVETRSAVFAYDNFLQKQDVDLSWIRHVMRSASLRRDRARSPDPGWVDWVAEQWVGRLGRGGGQLDYYERQGRLKAENYRRTTYLGTASLWVGISMAVVLALAASAISEDQRRVMLILMGVLPLIAGVRDTYSHKKAERELIKQYRFMGRVFLNARRLLDNSNDISFRRRVLKAVGNAALEEHAEWILMHRERPLEHGGL